MKDLKKKSLLGLVFTPIGLIILIIIGVVIAFNYDFSGFNLAIFDAESQLKQEYTTIWADETDGTAVAGHTENDAFISDGSIITYRGTVYADNAQPGSVAFKHNFYGQEVVILAALYGAKLNNDNSFDTNNQQTIFIFKPSTFEPNKVSVSMNGVTIKTIEVSNPFYITLSTKSYPNTIIMQYIGYKAQFACDLASDEVWIRESFAQQFSINDLSFRPTKFCDNERPFTLRNIAQGETKISIGEGIIPLNQGQTIPPRLLEVGEIVTINYATPNVAGVTNICQPDQANVKIAGIWVCSQVIEKTTITREVLVREILPVTSVNSFTFTSTETNGQFNIGNEIFKTAESYACQLPSEGEIIRPPNPEGCYDALLSYAGQQQTLKDKQIVKIADNINVQYLASGSIQGGDISKLDGVYIFSIDGKVMELEAEGGLNIRLNNDANLDISLTNNLPTNIISLKATQKVKATNQILPSQD